MAAIAMTDAQFEALMTAMTARLAGPRDGGSGGGGRRTILDKGFNRINKFSHGEAAWPDWSFDFKVALGAQSPAMRETLEVVEKLPEALTLGQVIQLDVPRAEKIG